MVILSRGSTLALWHRIAMSSAMVDDLTGDALHDFRSLLPRCFPRSHMNWKRFASQA